MFTIYAGDDLVYSSGYQEPRTSVLAPKCTVEIGKASTLSFILLPTHYLYESLFRLKTDIKAFLGETQIFNGRVLSLERDFFNQKTILCEGDLAFLLDSLQPPRVITTTPRQHLTSFITEHNIQVNSNRQFTIGIIDVPLADSSESFEDTSYRETKAAIETDLLGRFGGYLRTRVVNGTIYLDWLKLQNDVCNQTLQFGTNILDIQEQVFASDIYTVMLPTGPAPTPEDIGTEPDNASKFPMTIESVNGGSKLLENLDGIALYGRIVKTENIANAANPQDLKDKAEALFARTYKEQASTFSIKAIDLSLMGYDLDQFKVGHRTRILSPPHEIDTVLTVTKIQYDIEKFENSEVSLGIFSDELPSDLWSATLKGGSMSSSMGKVAGGGGGALGKALKYYTELEDYAKIEAKKIELIAEDLNIKAQTISIMAGDIASHGTLITQNKDAITLEASRATAAEGVLSGRITVEADRITAEVTRASEAEGDLSGRITVEADKIAAEVIRATEAEGVLSGRITVEADRITSEVARSTAAEGTLSSRITQTENEIDLRVTKAGVITSINIAPGTVKINADKLDVPGVITAGDIVVQNELSTERARITNLTTGLSTADVLKANYLESTGNLKVGGTTTTQYLVVNGSGSIPIFSANTQLTAGDLSATTGTFGTLKYGTTDVATRFTGIDSRITNLSNDISASLTSILTGPSMVYNSDRLDGKHSTDFLAATATAADSSKLGGKAAADYALATHAHNGYALSNHSHTDYATTNHTHKKADITDFPTKTSASFVTDVTRKVTTDVFVKSLSPYATGNAVTAVTLTVTKETYYFYT